MEITTSVKSKEENIEFGGSPLIHSINCIKFKKMTLQNVANINFSHSSHEKSTITFKPCGISHTNLVKIRDSKNRGGAIYN